MKQRASGPRRLPASAWVFDSGLALVAASLPMAFFASMPVPSGVPVGMLALGYALVLLHTLPLAARRRFPGTVLALCVASGLAIGALFLPPFFLGPAILVAVYSVAAVLFLLWLAFTPAINNLGQVLVIVALAVLAVVGIELLRRQTAEEFPPVAA